MTAATQTRPKRMKDVGGCHRYISPTPCLYPEKKILRSPLHSPTLRRRGGGAGGRSPFLCRDWETSAAQDPKITFHRDFDRYLGHIVLLIRVCLASPLFAHRRIYSKLRETDPQCVGPPIHVLEHWRSLLQIHIVSHQRSRESQRRKESCDRRVHPHLCHEGTACVKA